MSVKKLFEKLRQGLNDRLWTNIIKSETYLFAPILDSRFKLEHIRNFIKIEDIKEKLIELMNEEQRVKIEEFQPIDHNDSNFLFKKAKVGVAGKYANSGT